MKNIITTLKVITAASFVSATLVGSVLAVHLAFKPDTREPDLPSGMSDIFEEVMPDPQEDPCDDRNYRDTLPDLPIHKDAEAKEEPEVSVDPETYHSGARSFAFRPQPVNEDPASCPTVPDLENPDEDFEIQKPAYAGDPAPCPPLPDLDNPDEDFEIQKPAYADDPAPCPPLPDLDNPDEDIDIPKPSYEEDPAPRPSYDGTEGMCPTIMDTTQGVDNWTEFEKESE